MNVFQQIFAWLLLISTTCGSWAVAPQYGGMSILFFMFGSGILICTHDIKKQNKKVEAEHEESKTR